MAPPYPAEYPMQPGWARKPRKKMRTSSIVILITVLLLLAGGGVAAFFLLKSGSTASFKLGDGSVVGANIQFNDITLKQDGNNLTLSGTYDNKSKSKGSVYVTVQAVSKSNEQSITFTVPVVSGTGKSFTRKKTTNIKLESAALGLLFFEGTGSSGEDTNSSSTNGSTYPWESESSSSTVNPESSSAINNSYMENQTIPGAQTLPSPFEPGTSTP